jgi:hypothetical protein
MADATYEVHSSEGAEAGVARIDMKLEVVLIPVSDLDRAKEFTRGSDGGSTLTAPPASISAWSSSHRRAPVARSISERTSRRPLPVRPRHSWSFPTSWLPGPSWSPPRSRLASSSTTARKAGAADCIPSVSATAHAPYSVILTATAGSCRTPLLGSPGASDLARLPSTPQATCPARFGVRKRLTASTRSAPDSATRTGQTGTPPTWWRSSPAKTCRDKRSTGRRNCDGRTRLHCH